MAFSPPRNIEIFDRITAYTLIKLYESFPIPLNLNLNEIYDEIAQDCTDENEATQIYTTYITSTILFLTEEKFIQHDQDPNLIISREYFSAKLTLKGLALLGAIPKTVNERINNTPQSSFIELLKDSFKVGTKSALSDVFRSLWIHALRNISD
ncbi:hypothetical protein SAMN06296273_2820 [Nitrosomonas ureae]|uniref:Uncharacterized protein n=1 Tax=Nitrosomonas ureae TaxID=44577 RepID=A0A285C2Q3_9PROT|nr:hypothetical protein [Nitrosomonas ureae]SNX61368.1 hypothetical protein SAMN06296273_2820 [Nitrosomonas ureae]